MAYLATLRHISSIRAGEDGESPEPSPSSDFLTHHTKSAAARTNSSDPKKIGHRQYKTNDPKTSIKGIQKHLPNAKIANLQRPPEPESEQRPLPEPEKLKRSKRAARHHINVAGKLSSAAITATSKT
ncbi:unnamed protein product [Urochloa humidicola]